MRKTLVLLIVGFLLVGIMGVSVAKSENANPDSNGVLSSVDDSDDGDSEEDGDDDGEEDSGEDEIDGEDGTDEESEEDDRDDSNDGNGSGRKVIAEETYTLVDENQNQYEVTIRTETKERNEGTEQKIKVRNVEAVSGVEIEQEGEGNEAIIQARLSNGNKQEIKIMPDKASETAIEKLRSKNVSIELREVGEGNNLSVVYFSEANKTVKFLGLFKIRAQISAMISAENGEVIELQEPWWYALAFGGDENETPEDEQNETEIEYNIADVNEDGFVGQTDMDFVLSEWGNNCTEVECVADLSGDGFVGQTDMDIILENWGSSDEPINGLNETELNETE